MTASKASAKKTANRKAPASTPSRKAAAGQGKKTTSRKAPAKKAAAKKTPSKKAAGKKAPAKKTASKKVAKKKAPAKKASAKKASVKKKTVSGKAPAKKKTAAGKASARTSRRGRAPGKPYPVEEFPVNSAEIEAIVKYPVTLKQIAANTPVPVRAVMESRPFPTADAVRGTLNGYRRFVSVLFGISAERLVRRCRYLSAGFQPKPL